MRMTNIWLKGSLYLSAGGSLYLSAIVLRAHWSMLAATDFFTTQVWTRLGLKTIYTLFVIHLETRRVHIAVKDALRSPVGSPSWSRSIPAAVTSRWTRRRT